MSITVVVVKAVNVPKETFGKSDPYVLVEYLGTEEKTEVIKGESNPEWNSTLQFDLKGQPIDRSAQIQITIKDWERIPPHKTLGSTSVSASDLTKGGELDLDLPLADSNGKPVGKKDKKCSVSVRMSYQAPPGESGGGGGGGGGGSAQQAGGGDAAFVDEMGEEIVEEEGGGGAGGVARKGGSAGKSMRGTSNKNRGPLSTKPQDFQVRIKVVEGRQLEGANVHAVCRVTCLSEMKQTRVKKSTSQPVWNEVFHFSTNMSPSDIVCEQLNVAVYNARVLRPDAFIGHFQCDLGLPYDNSRHTIMNKWLLLTDKDDANAGVRGYVKVCITVLGPGDPAPSFKGMSSDTDDIESNLLMPAGIVLQPASFTISIYKGEDLPRMDTSMLEGMKKMFGVGKKKPKELVDPYIVCSFAGRTMQTKTMQGSYEPEWNEEVKLGFRFPSVAERLEFQIYDWDRLNADDRICTQQILLPSVSGSGEDGFLPTFGPCYVNFYGSVREFSLSDDNEDLNYGKGEGVAYRGRVLMEIKAQLEEGKCESKIEDIGNDDILRVQKYFRRHKYMLHVALFDATMMKEADAPVEFEISIGTYGNKLDDTVNPCASTTQPTNNVFDGCNYYFLPWEQQKPCIVIDSYWEDIAFRLEGVNMMLKITRQLEENLNLLQIGIKANLQEPHLKDICERLLTDLVSGCSRPLPDPGPKTLANNLDDLRRQMRERDLASIIIDANDLLARLRPPPPKPAEGEAELLADLPSPTDKSAPTAITMPVDGELGSSSGSSTMATKGAKGTKGSGGSTGDVTGSTSAGSFMLASVDDVIKDVDNFLSVLKQLAMEPQASIPDVFIWMLQGNKRVAYYRIPAHEVFYSPTGYSGVNCAKIQSITLKYPGQKGEKKWAIPGMLRMKMWFGCKEHEEHWHAESNKIGEVVVMAETYENQNNILTKWVTRGPMMTRPKWSDVTGRSKLKKEKFTLPPNWGWDGGWHVSPELSILFDRDAGHKTFIEDVYEVETRMPGGHWVICTKWTDGQGNETCPRDEISLPENWEWTDDAWEADMNRGCDDEGWEYCIENNILGTGWGPVEKTYHLCRRKRWIKTRSLVGDLKALKAQEKKKILQSEGWEYAPLFNLKFHLKERTIDLVRRRRWHRRMVCESGDTSNCFFGAQGDESESDADDDTKSLIGSAAAAPRMLLEIRASNKYQLRAYIYQARGLPAADDNSLSDPYAIVSFSTQSGKTEVKKKSLSPTWDQTLIIDEVTLFGDPNELATDPPLVCIEIFDQDKLGKDEFLGRCYSTPTVKLSLKDDRIADLKWHNVTIPHLKKPAGELLASFELLLMNGQDLPFAPPKKGDLYIVPTGIRPILQRTAIEVLCWGVRNMKKFQLMSITSPFVELEIGGNVIKTDIIKNTKKNPNFVKPILFVDAYLPQEEYFMPPVTMRVRDNRAFGRKPTVGTCVVKDVKKYRFFPLGPEDQPDSYQQPAIEGMPDGGMTAPVEPGVAIHPEGAGEETVVDLNQEFPPLGDDIDWWSKYYASIGDESRSEQYLKLGFDKLQVHDCALETVNPYKGFSDFCDTFNIMTGDMDSDDEGEGEAIGEMKGSFRFYALPEDPNDPMPPRMFGGLPQSTPEECIVRVYCIQASDLQPMDTNGLADPYVSIRLGKHKEDSRDDYIPNCLDPVFGKMFQFKALLPIEKDLVIKVKDYDLISSDDTIGQTTVDLENRYLTKYRGLCGLPQSYCIAGPNIWRDSQKPTELLRLYCEREALGVLAYSEKTALKIGESNYNLIDFEGGVAANPYWGTPDERLALHVLNTFPLVKEHIESRPLQNPLQPGFSQGKLEMWVDIFPKSLGMPGPPVQVQARKPKKYVLRCVIYNTVDVVLDETSITGEQMSDIYIKGWLPGGEKLRTDVHYRSLDGEGNFNWRFVFPFEYMPAEQIMICKKKEHFWSLDETEEKQKPLLNIQIWDNDLISKDDFLGTLHLDLNKMPKPAKTSSKCKLSQIPEFNKKAPSLCLFEQKRLQGFWPCYTTEGGKQIVTGKVEMEIEVLEESEAEERPAAVARDEPNMNPKLEPPNRPETSFFWLSSPWKSCKHIIWKNYKWYIIGSLVLAIITALIAIAIYSMPGAAWNAIFGTRG